MKIQMRNNRLGVYVDETDDWMYLIKEGVYETDEYFQPGVFMFSIGSILLGRYDAEAERMLGPIKRTRTIKKYSVLLGTEDIHRLMNGEILEVSPTFVGYETVQGIYR